MCSIILRIGPDGVLIGANRDEMVARAWQPPAEHWPELPSVVAGRDLTAGGTWMGVNAHGVMAAVLNREGTLGPAAGKHSRGELPLLALGECTAAAAVEKIAALDAASYRSFNLVIADAAQIFFVRGLEAGAPEVQELGAGTWMITSGEPNDFLHPRIARHLPKFEVAAWADWPMLLADSSPPALNVAADRSGFATVCSSLVDLPKAGPVSWLFAAGPAARFTFAEIPLPLPGGAVQPTKTAQ
jgi:hypothetical protein